MAQLKVGIIDDGYPGDTPTMDFDSINRSLQIDDWDGEEGLRVLNNKLTEQSIRWKKRISFSAFKHPEFFFNRNDLNYRFLIYDWEYKLNQFDRSSDDYLAEIFDQTAADVMIYSAWDKFDHISEMLSSTRFNNHRDRFKIYSKTEIDDNTQMINHIETVFKQGEHVKWEDHDIIIKPSHYLIDSDDFWKIKSLLGDEMLINYLTKISNEFTETSIEKLFADSKRSYFIDAGKNILSSSKSELLQSGYGELIQLTPLDALKMFGVDKLEEAKERGYTEII
jgi:hypothetical protein